MRAHEAALELRAQLQRDVTGGQGAEARGDAVVGHGVVGEVLDHLAALGYLAQGFVGEGHAGPVPGDGHDIGDGEGADPYEGFVHDSMKPENGTSSSVAAEGYCLGSQTVAACTGISG